MSTTLTQSSPTAQSFATTSRVMSSIAELLQYYGVTRTAAKASVYPHPDALVDFPFNFQAAYVPGDWATYQARYGHYPIGWPGDLPGQLPPDIGLYTRGNLGSERFGIVRSEAGMAVLRRLMNNPGYTLTAVDEMDLQEAAAPGDPSRSFIDAVLWAAIVQENQARSGQGNDNGGGSNGNASGNGDSGAGSSGSSGDQNNAVVVALRAQIASLQSDLQTARDQLGTAKASLAAANRQISAIDQALVGVAIPPRGGGVPMNTLRKIAKIIQGGS